MNFIVLASTLILGVFVAFSIKNSDFKQENTEQTFWAKEKKSNFVRKKSLEHLNYISIPQSLLFMQPQNPTAQTLSYLQDLNALSSLKIVNLTGISNTDLKLEYGTANITVLTEYDTPYTQMVTILQKLAECLVASGDTALAIEVLEFAISTGSDVSKSYLLLAELYKEVGTSQKIAFLVKQAEGMQSLMKNSILRSLKASGE